MLTRALLLRHAEPMNPSVFHGAESDVDLSARGRWQAQAVAPFLAAFGPAAVVCSAMQRARATGAPTAQLCGLALRVEPQLHERRVGALSGTPTRVRDGPWPQTLRRWLAGDTGFAPAGAESFDAIAARVLPVWRRLTEQLAGRTFVVVAHGVVCKVLLLSVLPGYSVADWRRLGPIPYVAVSELTRAGSAWEALRLSEVPPLAQAAGDVGMPPGA
jgi:broad specificity phosphatase PhoE